MLIANIKLKLFISINKKVNKGVANAKKKSISVKKIRLILHGVKSKERKLKNTAEVQMS
jgi:hypothetical protein